MSQADVIKPTETRNERRRRITDEKIAKAVLDIALRRGPHSVTFSAVCEESGVAKTTLYRRYQTREELFDAVARHYSSTPDESDEAPTTPEGLDRKSTRLNSSHVAISYAVFCLKVESTHN